jgi:signal peptidase
MNLRIFLRSKLFLVLLAMTGSLIVFSFNMYLRLDTIVHGDLYDYGLILSDEWAAQYWSASALFRIMIEIAIVLSGIGLATFYIYNKNGNKLYRWASIVLSFAIAVLASLSLFVFLRLDWIVHNTLYDFSLKFNLAWANTYWTYAKGILFLMGFASVLVFFAGSLLIMEGRMSLLDKAKASDLIKNAKRNRFPNLLHLKLNRKIVYWGIAGICLTTCIFFLGFYRPVGLGGDTRYEPVLTGSMEPTLPVGSLVIISPVDPPSLQIGDIICYRFSDSVLITHRIVNITSEGFQTKGDANEEPDRKIVTKNQIVGSVVVSIPILGYLGTFMKTPVGFLLMLIFPASLVIGFEIRTIIYEMNKIKKEKSNQRENPS